MKPQYRGHPDQRWGHISYAQHGDDFMLLNIFELIGVERPSYLDIGAHHPETISNTKLLYDRGSRGVNVDANEQLISLFNRDRPEDVNICYGVGVEGKLSAPFYRFSKTSGRNTLCASEAELFSRHMVIQDIARVSVITVNELIDTIFNGVFPDLLSIDIEGDDLAVLESADFTKSKPKVIVAETRPRESPAMQAVLLRKGYFCYCRMGENLFFIDEKYYGSVY